MSQLIVAGTATSADVMADVTFSAGTIYNGQGGIIRQAATSASPGATYGSGNLFVQVPTGAYLVAGSSGKPEVTLTTAKLQTADPDLIAANIRSGVDILGVTGTYVPTTALYDGWGSIVPSQVNSTAIIFPFSLTVPAGKTLLAFTIYNVYNSGLYVSTTQASGASKLCFTLSYIKDQTAPVSEIVTGTAAAPARVTFSFSGLAYNSSTGVISGGVQITQSGGVYATLNYPDIGLNFKAQYILA
jgi:hypothetical protein